MAKAVRLDKFLADAGKGTRSEVKKLYRRDRFRSMEHRLRNRN